MRPIKFRAWDEEEERFFFSGDENDDNHFFEFKDGTLRGFAIRPPRPSSDPMEPPEPYTDDYPVEQYTGLKDENDKGKEVYDGDYCLIRVDFSPPDAEKSKCENFKVHIFYDDELFAWCWHTLSKNGGQTVQFNEYEFDVIRVIGNITENPELLEGGD